MLSIVQWNSLKRHALYCSLHCNTVQYLRFKYEWESPFPYIQPWPMLNQIVMSIIWWRHLWAVSTQKEIIIINAILSRKLTLQTICGKWHQWMIMRKMNNNKLWFFIFETQCGRPLIFQTINSVMSNNLSLKYQSFTQIVKRYFSLGNKKKSQRRPGPNLGRRGGGGGSTFSCSSSWKTSCSGEIYQRGDDQD